MHPSKVKIGALVKVPVYGLAQVMKFFAPAFIGVVVIEGKDSGTWLYLRGLDLERTEIIDDNS